jgi:CubicO group peptidase (beta-lactamase class C family)
MIRRRQFLKQVGAGSLGLATMIYLPGCKSGPGTDTKAEMYSPESQGVSSQGLIDFFDAAQKSGLEFHSIMINRNAKTILEGWWEPFKKEYFHTLYSLSKSFTSTAIGMLHDEGKLDVMAPVISFFEDKLPTRVGENLAAMRVYDLLTMHTGHDQDTMGRIRTSGNDDWVKAFLQLDVPLAPGTHFLYNTGATFMLSAIVSNITGKNTKEYLTPRLFEPLGIVGADWEEDPHGINVGGYGLRVRTEDILNFGQLYLQKGEWKGKQLLSEDWISEATRKQVDSQDNDSDWGQGYGYQFWMCRPGCYRGDGAYGQYCIVIPEKNAVIAVTSESRDMGASMQLLWDHILPAMKEGSEPFKEDKSATDALMQRVTQLSLPIGKGLPADVLHHDVPATSFVFEENPFQAKSVSFNFAGDVCEAVFYENNTSITVKSGLSRWVTGDHRKEANSLFAIRGRTPMPTKISSYFYWSDVSTLVMHLKYVENTHADIFTFVFNEGGLALSFDNSLSHFNDNPDGRPAIKASIV